MTKTPWNTNYKLINAQGETLEDFIKKNPPKKKHEGFISKSIPWNKNKSVGQMIKNYAIHILRLFIGLAFFSIIALPYFGFGQYILFGILIAAVLGFSYIIGGLILFMFYD